MAPIAPKASLWALSRGQSPKRLQQPATPGADTARREGPPGPDGQAGEDAAGDTVAEEDAEEGGLAGLPLAGEEGDVCGREEALPDPVGRRGRLRYRGVKRVIYGLRFSSQ
jgi:hypothetical protein